MGWIVLSLRRNELQSSLQQKEFELLQLTRKARHLSNLSSAIGDGNITPSEIAGIGQEFFGDALDFMGFSNEAAAEVAQLQTDYYAGAYSEVTQQQYYNNPSLSAQASLYYDQDGNLDTDTMYNEFYEKALEEYAQNVVMPKLKEIEEEMANEQTEKEAEIESMKAELESVKESISQNIQSSTIRL